MPSPRALVAMRVRVERRLTTDIRALAERLDMSEEEVPQLLVPRVPNNDPAFKHVRFLEGVCVVLEKFLEHDGVNLEELHKEPEEPEMAEHSRVEVNPDAGVGSGAPGDPRLTNVGQGLADQSLKPVAGVVPGMLEGDEGEVAEDLHNVNSVADIGMLRNMETGRIGGPRRGILKLLDEREAQIKDDLGDPTASEEADKVLAERQAEAEEAAARQAAAEKATEPAPVVGAEAGVVTAAPGRQLAPERPPAATRQRRGPGRR